jgi:hypothetical protein
MRLTREFQELLQKRIARDAAFAEALFREGIATIKAGIELDGAAEPR